MLLEVVILLATYPAVRGSQVPDWLDRKCVSEKVWFLGDISWGNRVREALREHHLPVDMAYINNEFVGPMKRDLELISALPAPDGTAELVNLFVASYLNGKVARRRVYGFFPDLEDKESSTSHLRASDQLLAQMLNNFRLHNPIARCCHGCTTFV